MILRNNIVRMESSVEYHVATHAQDYAELVQSIQSEDELDDFLEEFPRVDSVAFDENNPSAYLAYQVDIQAADTTLPDSNVITKSVHIRMNNQFLQRNNMNPGASARDIKLKLIKSFNEE